MIKILRVKEKAIPGLSCLYLDGFNVLMSRAYNVLVTVPLYEFSPKII